MLKKQTIRNLRHALRNIKAAHRRPKQHYSQSEMQEFKHIVLRMRAEAIEDLRTLEDSVTPIEQSVHVQTDELSNEKMFERSMMSALREEHAMLFNRQCKLVRSLDEALKRIELENYGYCVSCGGLIAKERLKAVPHTQQCIFCKTNRNTRLRRAA